MRRHGEGVSAGEIYSTAQIPRSTFYDWLQRYRQHGLEGLEPKPRRPHMIHRIPVEIANEIKTVRIKTGRGPQKIAEYLRKQHGPVGHMAVYRTLLASGLNRPLTKPRTKRSCKCWQRMHPCGSVTSVTSVTMQPILERSER
jgi:transposase